MASCVTGLRGVSECDPQRRIDIYVSAARSLMMRLRSLIAGVFDVCAFAEKEGEKGREGERQRQIKTDRDKDGDARVCVCVCVSRTEDETSRKQAVDGGDEE